MSYRTKRSGVAGGLRVQNVDAPRPWQVKWSPERGHYLQSEDGTVVAYGFARLWGALMWAQRV